MIIISFVVCWIAVSAALAILGRHTLVGPVIIFLVSMFLTPLIAGLYVVIARLENRNIVVRGP
jgi:hypothetical protein